MKLLTPKQIEASLRSLPLWSVQKGKVLKRTFKTKSFIGGLSFVAKVVVHAEILNHHPDVEITYKTVTVKLSTHELGGITKLDTDLAKRIDGLLVA